MNWPPQWWIAMPVPARWLVLGVLKVILSGFGIYLALHMKGLV